jgi:predicted DNA-binding ribbon-helix-helix protein
MSDAALVKKRSLRIAGHNTSISLEEPFWRLLAQVAAAEGESVAAYVERIDTARGGVNLSSAIRVHLMEWMMARANLSEG